MIISFIFIYIGNYKNTHNMEKDRIKICIVMPCHWSHAMGGAEYQVKIIVQLLIESGLYDIYFLTRDVDPTYKAEGYTVIKINNIINKKRGAFFLDARKLLSNFKTIKPDVIYQRSGTGYTGICAYYSKINNCKFIWHIAHDKDISPHKYTFTKDFILQLIEKKFLEYGIRNSTVIVAQTNDQAKLLKNNYCISASSVIHNFHPLPIENIEKQKIITVVWVANLKPIKRPEVFLKLSNDLNYLQDVQFVMMGKIQGRPKWKLQFIKLAERSNNIKYLGFLDQSKVNEILGKSHILVNASYAEGFSNTFIQAWMRKVPVVSLTVNPDNILTNEGVGMCSGSYDQMLLDVKKLIQDSVLREAMGERAQAFAFANYSEKEANKLLSLLNK